MLAELRMRQMRRFFLGFALCAGLHSVALGQQPMQAPPQFQQPQTAPMQMQQIPGRGPGQPQPGMPGVIPGMPMMPGAMIPSMPGMPGMPKF